MIHRRAKGLPITAIVACGTLAGCGEGFVFEWTANPGQATLFSLDREELSRPSAFDMSSRLAVVIESPDSGGAWDFVVDREGGEMVLRPPSALGVVSRAGIAVIADVEYDAVRVAPSDTLLYSTMDPVPLADGNIYVIRTHQQPNVFGQNCFFYGKIDPIEVDAVSGVFRFLHDTSPDCNNRRLVPPD